MKTSAATSFMLVMLSTLCTPGRAPSAVGETGDPRQRGRREHVVGQDADHADVVAAELLPHLLVERDGRVARRQHVVERALEA